MSPPIRWLCKAAPLPDAAFTKSIWRFSDCSTAVPSSCTSSGPLPSALKRVRTCPGTEQSRYAFGDGTSSPNHQTRPSISAGEISFDFPNHAPVLASNFTSRSFLTGVLPEPQLLVRPSWKLASDTFMRIPGLHPKILVSSGRCPPRIPREVVHPPSIHETTPHGEDGGRPDAVSPDEPTGTIRPTAFFLPTAGANQRRTSEKPSVFDPPLTLSNEIGFLAQVQITNWLTDFPRENAVGGDRQFYEDGHRFP